MAKDIIAFQHDSLSRLPLSYFLTLNIARRQDANFIKSIIGRNGCNGPLSLRPKKKKKHSWQRSTILLPADRIIVRLILLLTRFTEYARFLWC